MFMDMDTWAKPAIRPKWGQYGRGRRVDPAGWRSPTPSRRGRECSERKPDRPRQKRASWQGGRRSRSPMTVKMAPTVGRSGYRRWTECRAGRSLPIRAMLIKVSHTALSTVQAAARKLIHLQISLKRPVVHRKAVEEQHRNSGANQRSW